MIAGRKRARTRGPPMYGARLGARRSGGMSGEDVSYIAQPGRCPDGTDSAAMSRGIYYLRVDSRNKTCHATGCNRLASVRVWPATHHWPPKADDVKGAGRWL